MASPGPQSFSKRQRERMKQMERQRKFANKLERNARKREEKAARVAGKAPPLDQRAPEDRDVEITTDEKPRTPDQPESRS